MCYRFTQKTQIQIFLARAHIHTMCKRDKHIVRSILNIYSIRILFYVVGISFRAIGSAVMKVVVFAGFNLLLSTVIVKQKQFFLD